MRSLQRLTLFTTLLTIICSLIFCSSVSAFDNPNLLPSYSTPVLDLAKSFNSNQIESLESSINQYEADSGWKIRVLTQFENTPGKAIKNYWQIDQQTLLIVADPRGGNLLNFNVGDAYFALMPRTFWVELQTRFGNQFYVRDYGEDMAIINTIKAVEVCLDKGGCQKVPGLTKEQWLWTLVASILGGFIAGIAGSPRNSNQLIAWKWLFLISPIWIIPFGVIGIAQVVTRTSEILPLLRNILAFMTSAIAAYLFAKSTLSKSEVETKDEINNK